MFSHTTFADEYWTETIPVHGKYAELPLEEFDYFSLVIPSGTKAELYKKGRWQPVEIENEHEPRSITSQLIEWNRGQPGTLRFSGNIPSAVTIDFSRIDPIALKSRRTFAATNIGNGTEIFSRADWGANEQWRYNGIAGEADVETREAGRKKLTNKEEACVALQKQYPDEYEVRRTQKSEAGQNLKWPYQYSKRIQKIIVHHTAETGVENGKSPEQVMRAIYRYHSVSRGWGDIGYHYVIAPNGEIYEGRAGGDYVVAGHAYCNNIGTIGVALMGNFNEKEPSNEQIASLRNVLLYLAEKYELDLTDEDWYHGKKTPNLLGHRDLSATSCPGEKMYDLLPYLRRILGSSSEIRFARSQKVDGTPKGSLPIITLKPGEERDIDLSFTNTGNAPWTNATWLFAQAGNGLELRSVSKSKKYVAARQKEKQVMPGETASFTATVKAGYKGGIQTVSFVPVVNDKRVKNAETLQVIEMETPNWGGKMEKIRTSPNTPVTGKSISISVDIRNTGDVLWKKENVSLLVSYSDSRKEQRFPLKKNTANGSIATFSGRLESTYSPGEKRIRLQLLNNGKKLPIIFEEKIEVAESKNRAELLDFSDKLEIGKAGGEYERKITFQNTGNAEWNSDDLRLEVRLRREKTILTPKQKTILPGEAATFDFRVPVNKGVHPYVLLLKDGRQALKAKVFILRGLSVGTSSYSEKTESPPNDFVALEDAPIRIRLSPPKDFSMADIVGEDAYEVRASDGKLVFPGRKGQKITIEKLGPLVRFRDITDTSFTVIPKTENGVLRIENWDRYPAWDINKKFNDNRFLGKLEIRVENGDLKIINNLPIGHYLLGIGETLESDHIEKKKALAVVARSYAVFYQNPKNRKFPGKPYDGSDDPAEFQKYLGKTLSERSPSWQQAIQETKNEVLLFNGEVIKAPYHTCSGGQTISAKEKWGWDHTPFLVSVEDPGCKEKPRQGHGVGLSGGGAQYFAENGWTYKDILKYYYPGTELQSTNQ
jgi:hypothetical protein